MGTISTRFFPTPSSPYVIHHWTALWPLSYYAPPFLPICPPPPWSKFSNFFWPHVIYYCTALWHLFPVLNFTSLLCSISLPCGTFLTFSNLPYVIYHWTALRTSLLYYASFVPLSQLASSGLFSLIRVPTRLTNICIDKLNNGVSFGYIFV